MFDRYLEKKSVEPCTYASEAWFCIGAAKICTLIRLIRL